MVLTKKGEPKLTKIADNDRYTIFDVEYSNGNKSQAILCKTCNRTSWNENDAKHRFCPCKGIFHDDVRFSSSQQESQQ